VSEQLASWLAGWLVGAMRKGHSDGEEAASLQQKEEEHRDAEKGDHSSDSDPSDSGEDAISLSEGSDLLFEEEEEEADRGEVASQPNPADNPSVTHGGSHPKAAPTPPTADILNPTGKKYAASALSRVLPSPSPLLTKHAAAATKAADEPESSAEEGELVGESATDYAEVASQSNGSEKPRHGGDVGPPWPPVGGGRGPRPGGGSRQRGVPGRGNGRLLHEGPGPRMMGMAMWDSGPGQLDMAHHQFHEGQFPGPDGLHHVAYGRHPGFGMQAHFSPGGPFAVRPMQKGPLPISPDANLARAPGMHGPMQRAVPSSDPPAAGSFRSESGQLLRMDVPGFDRGQPGKLPVLAPPPPPPPRAPPSSATSQPINWAAPPAVAPPPPIPPPFPTTDEPATKDKPEPPNEKPSPRRSSSPARRRSSPSSDRGRKKAKKEKKDKGKEKHKERKRERERSRQRGGEAGGGHKERKRGKHERKEARREKEDTRSESRHRSERSREKDKRADTRKRNGQEGSRERDDRERWRWEGREERKPSHRSNRATEDKHHSRVAAQDHGGSEAYDCDRERQRERRSGPHGEEGDADRENSSREIAVKGRGSSPRVSQLVKDDGHDRQQIPESSKPRDRRSPEPFSKDRDQWRLPATSRSPPPPPPPPPAQQAVAVSPKWDRSEEERRRARATRFS